MSARRIYYIVRSILVLAIGLFTFIFCFDGLQEFRLFFIPCFLGTLAINLCLLFQVQFPPRKIERIIAASYLILFMISLTFLYFLTGFALFNWGEGADKWDVTRMWISVLFTDYCIIWLAIRSLFLLLRVYSPLLKDTLSTNDGSTS